ncbi:MULTISPECIES: ABC transporter ATP-binding protein [unclassified Halomonas]|jgi:lipopolysaccharide transport system ATP-binding protein|uniref:ABC transporter ATP-binding protein n=1 Tax=Halomonas sp. 707B3 TaxID=1681043 RepID=UPI00209EB9A1|nr:MULTISPECIES: ABC transporter ATP-binding protein [unclassified Halomonas]MCP1317641.1 ABC transporter ATP-binding protein [Halomonas sp. 707B3]
MGKISINGLGKAYKVYPNRSARLKEWVIPGKQTRHELKWVLKDISFHVEPGEAVGIIGINGAGKSTLLKMITGTTKPTTGSVELVGRVAALLELGIGFHPDFTGRQNAYMAGQLLGYSVEDLHRLMPAIEEFAEIGDYIDQPVRVYSSGMQMRLAFSVATAHRPDILIVDEALSVGDAYFQHKSFDRIRAFREQGTTLLLVSHDKQAIQSICDRAIMLNAGRKELEGTPEEVMDYYNAMLAQKANSRLEQVAQDNGRVQTVSGTGEATVKDIALYNMAGEPVDTINVGEKVTLNVVADVHQDLPRLVLGYGIKDRLGQVMYGTNTQLTDQVIFNVKKGQTVTFSCTFSADLGQGSYSVQTALVSTDTHLVDNYEWRDLALVFNVLNIDKHHFAGCNWMQPTIGVQVQ